MIHLSDTFTTSDRHEQESGLHELSARFEGLIRMIKKSRSELDNSKLENAELKEVNQQLLNASIVTNELETEMKLRIAGLEEALQTEKNESATKIDQLNAALQVKEAEVNELKLQLSSLNETQTTCKAEHDTHIAQLKNIHDSKVSELQKSIESLHHQNSQMNEIHEKSIQDLQSINHQQSHTMKEEKDKHEAEILRMNEIIAALHAKVEDCVSTNNQLKKAGEIEKARVDEMVKENVDLKAVLDDDKQKIFIVKELEYRNRKWYGDGCELSVVHSAFQVGVNDTLRAKNLSSSLINRIFCHNIRALSLENTEIKYSEYKKMVASLNLEDVQLRSVTIKDNSGNHIEVDQILKEVSKINSFAYSFKNIEAAPETSQNLAALEPFSNLRLFWLFNIGEGFDLITFGGFIKKNPTVDYTLWFRCSPEYFAQIRKVEKNLVKMISSGHLTIKKY
uniref:Uncharacterized protein n=1 Tax=Panagrolaimus sp. ES5 TaxID=591445 RepID=A0AC34FMC6_9BILA